MSRSGEPLSAVRYSVNVLSVTQCPWEHAPTRLPCAMAHLPRHVGGKYPGARCDSHEDGRIWGVFDHWKEGRGFFPMPFGNSGTARSEATAPGRTDSRVFASARIPRASRAFPSNAPALAPVTPLKVRRTRTRPASVDDLRALSRPEPHRRSGRARPVDRTRPTTATVAKGCELTTKSNRIVSRSG